jgi:hypothetical protein
MPSAGSCSEEILSDRYKHPPAMDDDILKDATAEIIYGQFTALDT